MTEHQSTFDRSDLLPHWKPTLPSEERAALLAAWQAGRSCADCRHWEVDVPGAEAGICDACTAGALTAPADWTCAAWEAA